MTGSQKRRKCGMRPVNHRSSNVVNGGWGSLDIEFDNSMRNVKDAELPGDAP